MDIRALAKRLEKNNYVVSCFEKKEDAVAYLEESIRGKSIGFGGSRTLLELRLDDILSRHNTVYCPESSPQESRGEAVMGAMTAQVYMTSVNAVAETGELVNIDGAGNRVAASLFGHEKTYFIVGTNKVEPNLEKAIWRARNIAAPQNAQRLGRKTPCAVKADKCYDCDSPDRICNGLMVHMKKMSRIEMEVVLINENLGL